MNKKIASMATAELVKLYNSLSDKPVTKFADRKTAEARVEKIVRNFHSLFCPACGEWHDQTAAGLEGTAAADRFYCHHCDTEYYDNGCIYKKPSGIGRGEAIAKTWLNSEVAAKRSQRHAVMANGIEFKSVPAAFKALGLPHAKVIHFRMMLVEQKKASFGAHKFELLS